MGSGARSHCALAASRCWFRGSSSSRAGTVRRLLAPRLGFSECHEYSGGKEEGGLLHLVEFGELHHHCVYDAQKAFVGRPVKV